MTRKLVLRPDEPMDPAPFWIHTPETFGIHGDEDEFLYHVTGGDKVPLIAQEGLRAPAGGGGAGQGAYRGHSSSRVFFTGRGGLFFWRGRIEDHLFDQHDEPPEVVVLQFRRIDLEEWLEDDELGIRDARAPSVFVPEEALVDLDLVCMTPERLDDLLKRYPPQGLGLGSW